MLAAVYSTKAAVNSYRSSLKLSTAVCLVFAVAFAVCGGEEMSWGQRLFGFATPEMLSGNEKREFNLHNLSTDKVELVFYFGAGVAMGLLPLVDTGRWLSRFNLERLWPTPALGLSYCLASGFTYDMWNQVPMQFLFFAQLWILLHVALNRDTQVWRLAAVNLAALFIIQVCFLYGTPQTGRIWDITEYRELIIALAAAFYAVTLSKKSRETGPERLASKA